MFSRPPVTIKHTPRGVVASVLVHNAGYMVRRRTEVEARAALQSLTVGIAVVGDA
jgi:hypothetical protein